MLRYVDLTRHGCIERVLILAFLDLDLAHTKEVPEC
jgi:hypothetical protein